MTDQNDRRCGNCAAWSAHDATVMRAPCLLLPSGDEQQMERPIARIVNTMSSVPQRLAKNIALETPRDFGCRLHRFHEECDAG